MDVDGARLCEGDLLRRTSPAGSDSDGWAKAGMATPSASRGTVGERCRGWNTWSSYSLRRGEMEGLVG